MRDHLARSCPAWWNAAAPSQDIQRDQLTMAIQKMDALGEHRQFVHGAVALMTRWTIRPSFFRFLLQRCADHLEASGDATELRKLFLQWNEELAAAGVVSR